LTTNELKKRLRANIAEKCTVFTRRTERTSKATSNILLNRNLLKSKVFEWKILFLNFRHLKDCVNEAGVKNPLFKLHEAFVKGGKKDIYSLAPDVEEKYFVEKCALCGDLVHVAVNEPKEMSKPRHRHLEECVKLKEVCLKFVNGDYADAE
jgi:hypothetical protein